MTREPQSPSILALAVSPCCELLSCCYSRRAGKRNLGKAGFTLTHILRAGKFIMAGNSWLQKLEATNHNPPSDRKWREVNTGAQLTYSLIQSRTPTHGAVPPTFMVGLPIFILAPLHLCALVGGWHSKFPTDPPQVLVGWTTNLPPSSKLEVQEK